MRKCFVLSTFAILSASVSVPMSVLAGWPGNGPVAIGSRMVGVPDAYRGETVKAFVVLKDGLTATADEIIAFCRERMSG